MPYSYTITTNPRGYSITNGAKTLSWKAEAPHVIQPTPDDGTDAWLERAATAAVAMFDELEISEPLERQREQAAEFADAVLIPLLLKQTAESADMTDEQIVAAGAAGFFDTWEPGQAYVAGKRLTYNGTVYVVVQAVTAQAHQPPGSAGMLAVYRPIEVSAAGTKADPIPFVYGMNVENGKYYSFNGVAYLAKADMKPCVWNPGTAGVWQWEAVSAPAGAAMATMAMADASSAPTRYLLNTTKATYHQLDCADAVSGSLRTLEYIMANHPEAKPCTKCAPPALPEGTTA